MPLDKRTQVLAVIEKPPNAQVTSFAAADAVDVLEASVAQDRSQNDRDPSSGTLSRAATSTGRGSRSATIAADFKGSGTANTEPGYSKLLQSGGASR